MEIDIKRESQELVRATCHSTGEAECVCIKDGFFRESDIMSFQDIRCQEVTCPYGKSKSHRCIFGEVCTEDVKNKPGYHERHKCPRGKEGKLKYVMVVL